jgi:hypothetical protein
MLLIARKGNVFGSRKLAAQPFQVGSNRCCIGTAYRAGQTVMLLVAKNSVVKLSASPI